MSGFLSGKSSLSVVTTNDIADGAITEAKVANDAITEVKVANDAIGLSELKAGTDGQMLTWDASGNPTTVAVGTSGHFLKSAGAGSVPVFAEAAASGLTSLTPVGTTGSTVNWSIPTGTTIIVMQWDAHSDAGGAYEQVQIGDAGGIETSGYNSGSNVSAYSTTGFVVEYGGAAIILSGQMILTLMDPSLNTWTASHAIYSHSALGAIHGAGTKSLSAELTQIQITNPSSFDAGRINVSYM